MITEIVNSKVNTSYVVNTEKKVANISQWYSTEQFTMCIKLYTEKVIIEIGYRKKR